MNVGSREIVVPLARQLSWSHFLALIPIKSSESATVSRMIK